MQISSVSCNTPSSVRGNDPSHKAKQAFSSLEDALNSGDLTAAADALTQLEKNAPQAVKNPLGDKVEALSQAIDSGNLSTAKDTFAEIKKAIASFPGGDRIAGGPSKPAGVSQDYDPKDTDKNGQVSVQEELSFAAKNPDFLGSGAGFQHAGAGQNQLDSLFDALA